MRYKFKHVFILSFVVPYISLADDFSSESVVNNATDTDVAVIDGTVQPDSISVEDQLGILSKQLTNFQQQNYIERIDQVQQDLQNLRGIMDVQSHEIESLKMQLADAYTKKNIANTTVGLSENGAKVALVASTESKNNAEIEAYQTAFTYLKSRDYGKSLRLFNEFLTDYPEGKYAPNAHYWLGEIYLLQGEYSLAESNLKHVIENSTENNKTPDAILKLAMVYVNMKNTDKARELVMVLEKKYPNTTAARMAKIQLGSL